MGAQRVMSCETGSDINTGETVPVYGEPCDLFVAQVKAQRDSLKARLAAEQFLKAAAVALTNIDNFFQRT